ncbi:tetraspanin-11-like [Tripterygium wilfordii]|uniref:Tetraspanin-11-like n=1 Tax=Tripterygium wilfordii TaxID=458696 RepID=A0A7J7C7W5_TRIWF|nr:tetraspanin-8-like [Tripterygium wilfordii]KAF5730229.1 tetraspanin-11-like [Tripterygium wilfordii]
MASVSNTLVAVLNCVFLVIGLALLGSGIYFHVHGHTECQGALEEPLLVTGTLVSFLSLLGLIGSCCKNNFVMRLYSFMIFLLLVALVCFTVFAFVVTNKSAGKALSGLGFKEHRLGDYNHWLQNHFVKGKNWDKIRSCLVESQVCKSLGNNTTDHNNAKDFFRHALSDTQSGCCKPPLECGFQFKNMTTWTMPDSGQAVMNNSDCDAWSNNQESLCFDCGSCKAGVLANIRNDWRLLSIFFTCLIIFTLFMYSIAECARRRNREEDKYRRSRAYA